MTTRPSIVFALDPDRADAAVLARGAVELALRLGLPFALLPPARAANCNEALCLVPPDTPVDRGAPLSFAATSCGPVAISAALGPAEPWPGPAALWGGVAALAAFHHEPPAPRDAFGRLPAGRSALALAGLLDQPLMENAAALLRHSLATEGHALPPARQPFGPQGVLALSHDVDGPRLLSPFALARAALRAPRSRGEAAALAAGLRAALTGRPDPYWQFDAAAQRARALGGGATFFFYPGASAGVRRHSRDPRYHPGRGRFAGLLEHLVEAGHEVGLHPGIHAARAGDYAAGAALLETLCQAPRAGIRTHYYRLDGTDPHASWAEMARAGLRYDASLSPLELGYRAGAMLPLLGGPAPGFAAPAAPFPVLPAAVMDLYARPRDAAARGLAIARAERLVDNARGGGLVVLNWHVRALSGIGPWEGLVGTLDDLIARARANGLRLMRLDAVAEAWRSHLRALWCTS